MAKIIYLIILNFILISVFASSFQTNSKNYTHYIAVVDSGGGNVSTGTYKNIILINTIAGIINSTNYMNLLGFLNILLLADSQPCSSASQCEGGYCCSGACSSLSCPVEAAVPSTAGDAGPSGTGAAFKKIKSFEVDKDLISVSLIINKQTTEYITITNTGDVELIFKISSIGLEGFVFLSEKQFKLSKGESKRITLKITGKDFGVTTGAIDITADGIKKSIPIIIEVETEKALFDVKIDIPLKLRTIKQGVDLRAQITLFNVMENKIDVYVTYLIKDLTGSILSEESESFFVETQKSYTKKFYTRKLSPGKYVAVVEVIYANSYAVSSQMFEISEEKALLSETVKELSLIIIGSFLVAGLIVISISRFKIRVKKRR